jgi:hypothetical protein
MLAVLVAALGMAAFESFRPTSAKDEDDVALFVGSAHPRVSELPTNARRR